MKCHHLRNATLIIEVNSKFILIDPMLGKKGTLAPFTLFRYKAKRNPLVNLPENSQQLLDKVTHCLITHLHPDHLDDVGIAFLKEKNISVVCSQKDAKTLLKKGLNIMLALQYWHKKDFLDGAVTGIPARHGYGWIHKPMGNVMGFYIELPDTKSVYISADTIYTDPVHKVLTELKPDVAVVACGTARLDIGKPLLMMLEDIVKFVKNAPQKVIANHLEALNHCPTTRVQLKQTLEKKELLDKVFIPADGETITIY